MAGRSDQDILQRAAARDLAARYATLVDRGRSTELAALFTDDGVLEVNREEHRGPDAIAAFLEEAKKRLAGVGPAHRMVRHHLTTIDVEPDGPDRARVAAYFLAVAADGLDHWGRYADDVVRTNAGWRFAHRRVTVEGARPESVAEAFLGGP